MLSCLFACLSPNIHKLRTGPTILGIMGFRDMACDRWNKRKNITLKMEVFNEI